MDPNDIYPGCLLVAPPTMQDQRFDKSVILMVDHSGRGGSLGLVVNRRMGVALGDVISETVYSPMPDIPLYWGGPVNPWGLWMLHSTEWSCDHTWPITDEWSVSSSEEIMEALTHWATPQYYRLFMGHASWSHGQLESEIKALYGRSSASSWLVAQEPSPMDLLGDEDGDDLWLEATHWSSEHAVKSWL